ncbi:MAG TPA: hypothetical protein VFO01_13870 [Trebonia sp.]|nr:hypothetical protein [Trebonia sp.]
MHTFGVFATRRPLGQIINAIAFHVITGGLGSAVAEAIAQAGLGRPLRRVGLRDTFAEGARTGPCLFARYGLSTQPVIGAAWSALGRDGRPPAAEVAPAEEGEYALV